MSLYSIIIEAKISFINPLWAAFIAYGGGLLAAGLVLFLHYRVIPLPFLEGMSGPKTSEQVVLLMSIGVLLSLADMLYFGAFFYGGTFQSVFFIAVAMMPAMIPLALLILGQGFDFRYIPGYIFVGAGVFWIIRIMNENLASLEAQ